jgi:5-methylcytosine-specific restriction endonuclease McrA
VVGVTPTSLGAVLNLEQFLPLMLEVGWLETTTVGGKPAIRIPKFDAHLSGGAKSRARNSINQRHRRVTEKSPRGGDTIPAGVRKNVYARDNYTCRYCGFKQGSKAPTGDYVGASISIDHVIPSSQGGDVSLDNCVCCCTVCNRKKNGRTPEEAGMILSPERGDESVTREDKRREEKTHSSSLQEKNVFARPTLEEVKAYCLERGKGVDPQKWFDHYESNGWRVGRNPMRDWKAAVRKWENSEYGNGRTTNSTSRVGAGQRYRG